MDAVIREFLAGRTAQHSVEVPFSREALRVRADSYRSLSLPPSRFVTSVRAIVVLDERVVALRNRDGVHVMPGGRIEPRETYAQALRREVHEETGLIVTATDYLGFVHLHHLTPRPKDYALPYPDMLHLVYAADVVGELRSGDPDGWEIECMLLTADAARAVNDLVGLPFLDAALARARARP